MCGAGSLASGASHCEHLQSLRFCKAGFGIVLHLTSWFFPLKDKHLAFAAFRAASGFPGCKVPR